MALVLLQHQRRHCEEQSDEAIHLNGSQSKMECRVACGSSQ